MLHLTNGDATAGLLRAAGMRGTLLPWRDVLHEGPVPAGLDLDALSDTRARFLAGRGWGNVDEIRDDFARRNATLRQFRHHDEVLLWFEHDLYDQLQIVQILDWLAGQDRGGTRLTMICIGSHPGVKRFRGLSDLTPEQIAPLFETRQPITQAQLTLAVAVWHAFRHPDPTAIETLLATDTSALPFVEAALRRHLQQYPSVYNGLGRTEHHALATVAAGPCDAVSVFRAHADQEESPFLGDWSFWDYLKKLAAPPHPLLHIDNHNEEAPFTPSTLTVTEDGRRVLNGQRDFVHLNGLDRWLGGVHLLGSTVPWRWDEKAGCLRSV